MVKTRISAGSSLRNYKISDGYGGKRKRNWWKPVLCLILILCLGGAGVFGYFQWQGLQDELAEQRNTIAGLEESLKKAEDERSLLQQSVELKDQKIEELTNAMNDPDQEPASSNPSKPQTTVRRAYLTFDDGPSENANRVMDILDQYGIKGTFFMNGKESDMAAQVYSRVMDDGHVLANHTYSHVYKDIYASWDAFYADIVKMENCVKNQTGKEMAKIVRFPGGSNNGTKEVTVEIKEKLTELGYTFFDWNVSGQDAIGKNVSTDTIYKNVVETSQGKLDAVVLLHTTNNTNNPVEALPRIIEYLKGEGFEFHTLDEPDAPVSIVFKN